MVCGDGGEIKTATREMAAVVFGRGSDFGGFGRGGRGSGISGIFRDFPGFSGSGFWSDFGGFGDFPRAEGLTGLRRWICKKSCVLQRRAREIPENSRGEPKLHRKIYF